ncbi:telomerase Cajal body protein 1-like [Meleagris gallopavo]|uniref:telomerase Cajal body protein 1-like n=1 Tax=Meleagris gallopavo TaxID=9103 RepID=UPI00093E52AC|nr:telomerase Cajal body protein 1-like [Meleagris gallopavo]
MAMERRVATNQRVTFDLDPNGRLVVGGTAAGLSPSGTRGDHGSAGSCSTASASEPCGTASTAPACTHAAPPGHLLRSAHFPTPWDSDEEGGTPMSPPGVGTTACSSGGGGGRR